MTYLKPYGRRIHVRPEAAKTLIQSNEANLIEKAVVIAVGTSVFNIRVGDIVLFTSFGVDSIDIDGERNYFLLDDDAFILAIERDVAEEPMQGAVAASVPTSPTMVSYTGGNMSDMSSTGFLSNPQRSRE